MRDCIDCGTRMNRRFHLLPFAGLQEMVSEKATWVGIPSDEADPEYTSQRYQRTECQHTSRGAQHEDRSTASSASSKATVTRRRVSCRIGSKTKRLRVCRLSTFFDGEEDVTGSIGSRGGFNSHGVIFASGVHQHGASAQDSSSHARGIKLCCLGSPGLNTDVPRTVAR